MRKSQSAKEKISKAVEVESQTIRYLKGINMV